MAQIVRAILFAKAIATTIFGLRANIRASHDPWGIDFLPSQVRRDIAPIMRSRRISACPAFETRPGVLCRLTNIGAAQAQARLISREHF